MDVSFPEHRLYSVLCSLQAGIVMIGTVMVRVNTMDFGQAPAHGFVMWLRYWGFLFLLVPVSWLIWATRAARRDQADQKTGLRMATGVAITISLGVFFWWMFVISIPGPAAITD